MSRKPRVQRTPEEKCESVLEGLRSGNVAEACRRYGIAPNLFYRWKDGGPQGAQGATAGLGCENKKSCDSDRSPPDAENY